MAKVICKEIASGKPISLTHADRNVAFIFGSKEVMLFDVSNVDKMIDGLIDMRDKIERGDAE